MAVGWLLGRAPPRVGGPDRELQGTRLQGRRTPWMAPRDRHRGHRGHQASASSRGEARPTPPGQGLVGAGPVLTTTRPCPEHDPALQPASSYSLGTYHVQEKQGREARESRQGMRAGWLHATSLHATRLMCLACMPRVCPSPSPPLSRPVHPPGCRLCSSLLACSRPEGSGACTCSSGARPVPSRGRRCSVSGMPCKRLRIPAACEEAPPTGEDPGPAGDATGPSLPPE